MSSPKDKEREYVENSLARIQAVIAGACIGSNLAGLQGREWHYDRGKMVREMIEKEIMKLYKYAKRKSHAQ